MKMFKPHNGRYETTTQKQQTRKNGFARKLLLPTILLASLAFVGCEREQIRTTIANKVERNWEEVKNREIAVYEAGLKNANSQAVLRVGSLKHEIDSIKTENATLERLDALAIASDKENVSRIFEATVLSGQQKTIAMAVKKEVNEESSRREKISIAVGLALGVIAFGMITFIADYGPYFGLGTGWGAVFFAIGYAATKAILLVPGSV